ncbi:hypothetical protein IL252_05675 [Halomicrobium sp. IBSBa]|uniref:hypothetical protein n=1 Tax=Halomicrobium sp. IBSBa TaxID=2778916 RepID=UPI001ABFE64D|nr:hypothetical protein [Halomicrobium sp. IBSBa]MBO4247310.1 hypothetical protein [Halomicrobium sp. IBSBa]
MVVVTGTSEGIGYHLLDALRMIRTVLPHMRTQGGGIVHTMGPGVGQVDHPGLSGYALTKGPSKHSCGRSGWNRDTN